jgi:hypothetical protein
MSGSALARLIVLVTEKLIVSEPLLLPAAHSPAIAPDAVFVLAAVIASRKLHNPSVLLTTSVVMLTVIVLPAGAITPLSEATLACWWLGRTDTNTTSATQIEMKSTVRDRT